VVEFARDQWGVAAMVDISEPQEAAAEGRLTDPASLPLYLRTRYEVGPEHVVDADQFQISVNCAPRTRALIARLRAKRRGS